MLEWYLNVNAVFRAIRQKEIPAVLAIDIQPKNLE